MANKAWRHIEQTVHFGSHMPVLIQAVELSAPAGGPILEMGMGMNSSLFLHWATAARHRTLWSFEADPEYFGWARQFRQAWHNVITVESGNWEDAWIEAFRWDVALLDHGPAERRIQDVRRLADKAEYLILHDAEGRRDFQYHYTEIYDLFKWRWDYQQFSPKTVVLSNFNKLKDLARRFA